MQAITKSAARTVGMLYRRFYKHALSRTLVKNVHSHGATFVRVCCTSVGSLIAALERAEKMALRLCAKNWSANYEDLLLQFNLPSLRQGRELLKLSFFFSNSQ